MSENKNILKTKIWKWTDEITQLYLIQPSHAITSKQKKKWKLRKMKMRSRNNKNMSTAAPSRDKLKWAKKKTVRVNLFNTHRKCEVCETERWRKTAYAFVEIHMIFSSSFCRLYWKKEMLYTSPDILRSRRWRINFLLYQRIVSQWDMEYNTIKSVPLFNETQNKLCFDGFGINLVPTTRTTCLVNNCIRR